MWSSLAKPPGVSTFPYGIILEPTLHSEEEELPRCEDRPTTRTTGEVQIQSGKHWIMKVISATETTNGRNPVTDL